MADSVSFKVYLKEVGSQEQGEVRRFVVDKDVSSSFTYLQEKLATIYPRLRNEIFTVNWTDEDGDDVTIATDEELIIALTEMKGPLYKIQVQVKGGKKNEGPKKENGNTNGEVHPNVTCDGCEKPVSGFRYKCMVCDDYDLCGNCDAAGIHPGHNMMRIASPEVNFPHHFFKRLHKMQERAEQRSRCRQERQENKAGEANNENDNQYPGGPGWFGGFGGAGRGRPGRGMFRGRGGPRGGAWAGGPMGCGAFFGPNFGADGGAWAGTFDAMMKGWTGQEAEGPQQPQKEEEKKEGARKSDKESSPSAEKKDHYAAHEEALNASRAAHEDAVNASRAAHAAHQAAMNAAQQGAHQAAMNAAQQGFAAMNGTEYLKNVGSFVAAALDPYGIDVQVDIETPDGKRQSASSFSSTFTQSNTPKEKSPEPERKDSPKEKTSEPEKKKDAPKETSPETEKEKDLKDAAEDSNSFASSDDEDWTVLKESPRVVNVPIEVSDQPAKVLYASPDGTLYPDLPKEETTPAAPVPTTPAPAAATPNPPAAAPSAPVSHPDPRIQVALQAMINMGFTNDGGWLTNLLEAKNGDIGQALDVLQPVRK